MSEVLYAIILGLIQGIAEFLPISSSGHLILVSNFLDGKTLPLSLNIALHMGTVFAVLIYFWRDWYNLTMATARRIGGGGKTFESDVLLPGLIIGSIPAGVIGLLWEKDIEKIFHNPVSVCIPLAVVGVIMWVVDIKAPVTKKATEITIKDAFLVGIAQAFALIPGTSRSGATIIGGRLLGLSREDAARFSFMLGTPAMAGAALLKSKELIASMGQIEFYVGFLTSFLIGMLTISFLLKFLRNYGFLSFTIYRIALAIVIAAVIFL